MPRPLFQLGPRLAACAALVRPGSPLADVGADHAYLPIWLLRTGKIPRAVACDINPSPLESARAHAKLYGVEDRLRLALGDGLTPLGPEDADDLVIAGIGGDVILHIIGDVDWLRRPEKRLILQPMSAADKLRLGLCREGFRVGEEVAVEDGGRVYTAFSAEYAGGAVVERELFPYMGRLRRGPGPAAAYAGKTARNLRKQLEGALCRGEAAEADRLRRVLRALEEEFL